MTAYAVSLSSGGSNTVLTIVPSSIYQVRIARIEVSGYSLSDGGTLSYAAVFYPSSTPSGGTAITPVVSMRSGAPAATATIKSGATISGSAATLHQEIVASQLDTVQSNLFYAPMNSQYSFAFDFIMSAGSTLYVGATFNGGGSVTTIVYFEELRLAWSG